jgi:tripeptidyl-peptidase-1
LTSFLSQFRTDIASSTTFNLQTIDGGVNPQGQFLAGVEANLDVQYTIGLATGIPTNFLSVGGNFQDGDLEGFLDTVNFVSAQSPISYVMTTSYGQDESTISQALAVKLCNAYASLGAQGVSILFASGDGGVSGSQPKTCTKFVPTFPSDCPYLTSVGATTGINPEKAALFSSGGFSNYFGIPSYQSKAVKSYITGLGTTNSGKVRGTSSVTNTS